jgi:hypothetical protein
MILPLSRSGITSNVHGIKDQHVERYYSQETAAEAYARALHAGRVVRVSVDIMREILEPVSDITSLSATA